MKVPFSDFLSSVKPVLLELVAELSRDFPYVSILGTDCSIKTYDVRKTRTSIQDSSLTERGFVIRACDNGRYSELSFNSLPDGDICMFAERIRTSLRFSIPLKGTGISENIYQPFTEDPIRRFFAAEVGILPESMPESEIIARLTEIKDLGLSRSDLLIDFAANLNYGRISKIFLSNQKELEQAYVWSCGFLHTIARKSDNTKWFFKSYSGLKGLEILSEMKSGIQDAVDGVIELLNAEKVDPGVYDVICSPPVAGLIAHEAFGHGVEMDMFVKERARSMEFLGKKVASEIVTMHDGARSAAEVASYFFDDEGVLGNDTVVIDHGILKTGISDLLSAQKLGTIPTGNGRRESFERKAYSRMTNTIYEGGSDSLDRMIASIKSGYLLEHSLSGMEDPKNWGIQCSCILGREIREGRLTGKIVNPVIITGFVPDMLSSISMMTGTVVLNGSGGGYCGKGYKESVKVSAGGPYLKARMRLG
ncbi:MAG: TldD/PmbA family protein [Candidatus Wallbacteria bacterium]|nr:TldD/PmbA family protein [Candidatus Wallbacteria bacterium]